MILLHLYLDKLKGKKGILDFNLYIKQLNDKTKDLKIFHEDSKKELCINLADLFAWGIFRKYEKNDLEWYKVFKNKIKVEKILE
ncbi:MAG: DUF3800 domain-containing protein [Elusimicrobiota bacterium]|jgi:hypothetical protein|nr:DUF3800 domain-containing protein [Elusimicrobiota bacterium]